MHTPAKLLSFEPAPMTANAGTTVTWHAGDSIAHTLTTGTYTCCCSIHHGMSGAVVVES